MSARNATKLHPIDMEHPMHAGVTVSVEKITPATAAEWLGRNQGNRNQRPYKIAQYVRDLRDGNWMLSSAAIAFDWNGRMIDGQHRCEAAVESGVTFQSIVVRGLDPRVQDVIDQGAKRSAADALKFNGIGGNATTIASVAKISAAVDRGELTHYGDSPSLSLSHSEVIDWYSRNREVDHAAALAHRIYKKVRATPSPLAYAILRTEQIDTDEAYAFFNDIGQLRTDGVGDPRHALLEGLRVMDGQPGVNTAGAQLSLIFRAWNAYRQGKHVTRLSSSARGLPVAIPEPK